MHRFSNASSVFRFRVAAILLLLKWPLVLYALYFLFKSLLAHEERNSTVPLAMGVLAFSIILAIYQTMIAARCRCPLCVGQPLARTGAARRRDVPRLFGSYRLRLVYSIFTRGHFRCPYCGEPVAMQVRERRRYRDGTDTGRNIPH